MHGKMTARAIGALFLTATAAGVLSAVLLGPFDSPSPPRTTAEDAHRITAGAVAVMVMIGAIALIPTTLFPVLKEHGEARAIGYVVVRVLEGVLLLPAAVGPLVLVAMGADGVRAGTADEAAGLDAVHAFSRTYDVWGHASSALFFCLGVLLLNSLLYRSRLVPRWLSGWALVAAVPYSADACLVLFGVLDPSSMVYNALFLPLALNEMVLAGWLLTKGFRSPSSTVTAQARDTDSRAVGGVA